MKVASQKEARDQSIASFQNPQFHQSCNYSLVFWKI